MSKGEGTVRYLRLLTVLDEYSRLIDACVVTPGDSASVAFYRFACRLHGSGRLPQRVRLGGSLPQERWIRCVVEEFGIEIAASDRSARREQR
jgi:hypothetical protein